MAYGKQHPTPRVATKPVSALVSKDRTVRPCPAYKPKASKFHAEEMASDLLGDFLDALYGNTTWSQRGNGTYKG